MHVHSQQRTPAEVAREAARRLLAQFNLTSIRIHLFGPHSTLPDAPVARATVSPRHPEAGLTREALIAVMRARDPVCEFQVSTKGDPRFELDRPVSAFLGVPIPGPLAPLGFIECYRISPFTRAVAVDVELAVEVFAVILESAQAAAVPELPTRGTILIADDDPSVRMLLRHLLTRANYRVIDVENGARAYQEARTQAPDLILIDWMMPVMDGRTATMQLKADPRTCKIPVMMLTLQSQVDEKIAALEAGVQDFVTKPFDGRELLARLEQQLRWRRLLSVNETPVPEAPALIPRPPEGVSSIERGTDNWTQAVEAAQLGLPRDALTLYIAEGEACEIKRDYARGAVAFRNASLIAGDLRNKEQAERLLRSAGTMYSAWLEAAEENVSQGGFLYATRHFLATGDLKPPEQ